MLRKRLVKEHDGVLEKFPRLSFEMFCRLKLLVEGVKFDNEDSYPDNVSRHELIFLAEDLTQLPLLTLKNPDSQFEIISGGTSQPMVLMYQDERVSRVIEFEERVFDLSVAEPHYFYVEEINGDLVLKLNPIQLCDFFQNPVGLLPCEFCFRNDMVHRFSNITAVELIEKIEREENLRDGGATLRHVDEVSIVTGSYTHDELYLQEMKQLVKGIKKLIRDDVSVVIGSHEGKGKKMYQELRDAGVTTFAFALESIDDHIRSTKMKNRKGGVPVDEILTYIAQAIDVFGDDGVIVRLVVGMGDDLGEEFVDTVRTIVAMGTTGPRWNLNVFMPFTHYHWRKFQQQKPFTMDYIYKYCDIIHYLVPASRIMRFKISP